MPERNVFPWATGAQFNSFWAHYDLAEKWRQQHKKMVHDSLSFAGENGPDASPVLPHVHVASCSSPANNQAVVDEPMEVDEEYLEFQRITMEHRKKRDDQREAEEAKSKGEHWLKIDGEDYILADKIGVHGVEQRTLEEPDEKAKTIRKREEARRLYGNAAEKLLAMETAMDMHFDGVMRSRQPPLWPNIPLRF